MEVLETAGFLDWAAARGIVCDDRFADSAYLTFDGMSGESRYWSYPPDASSVPDFVDSLLDAVGPDETWWFYPGGGYWSLGGDSDEWPQSRVRTNLIRALGVPGGFVGAVGGLTPESDNLLSLLSLQVTLGPAVYIDAYAVPESGAALLRFEHHGAVSASFRDPAALTIAVTAMQAAGYPLPSTPPDSTFKPVSWMDPSDQ